MKTVIYSILAILFVLLAFAGFMIKILHWPLSLAFIYAGSAGALIMLVVLMLSVIKKQE